MTRGSGDEAEVRRAIADAHRREWAFVLAATVRVTGDLDVAEECVQDAYLTALDAWLRRGIPERPGAWLTTTARNRALDLLRRDRTLRAKLPLLVEPACTDDGMGGLLGDDGMGGFPGGGGLGGGLGGGGTRGGGSGGGGLGGGGTRGGGTRSLGEGDMVPDDRLRLIFTCCHPALAREAQVALTLRLLCGLSTGEIAGAFLVTEPAMAARVTRAKKKIMAARIAYRVPGAAELPDRLDAVLTVVHLLYTTGHTAPAGGELVRHDLIERAFDLARMLRVLMPDEREVAGLLALMLLTDARRSTRTGPDGRLALLAEQDRTGWDRDAIAEGRALVLASLRGGRPGRFALQAAIAALHAEAPSYGETDWPQILGLYGELLRVWPSPVVALNRAVALSMVSGPAAALTEVEALEEDPRLSGYRYLPATRADLLRRLGRGREAVAAYRAALDLCDNETERAFLSARIAELSS